MKNNDLEQFLLENCLIISPEEEIEILNIVSTFDKNDKGVTITIEDILNMQR